MVPVCPYVKHGGQERKKIGLRYEGDFRSESRNNRTTGRLLTLAVLGSSAL